MNLELPGPKGYCTSQLIPYLGNKRSLLPRLMPVLCRLADGKPSPRFLDVFSGSGAVSRLARAMGMRVEANDWEPYCQALHHSWLALSKAELCMAFGGQEGLKDFLLDWNSMHPQSGQPQERWSNVQPYMARWYAPACTESPRLGQERLFYTAENAVFIDRVRQRLEHEFPSPIPGSKEETKRRVVLASLLLEAAVHANTSGVFKAYHAGFGGHGKDALGRIMARMELEAPVLPDAHCAKVYSEDALAFVAKHSGDVAYFDPPYNQHQYGSNYHILNTIVRWDRQPRPMETKPGSSHSKKAGIPLSWKETKSQFCSKKTVIPAIKALVDASDASHLVFSWNADAHVSGEDMAAILAARGTLEIVALDYVSYRGGRQSDRRSVTSREYLFVVDTKAQAQDPEEAVQRLRRIAAIDDAMRSSYDPEKVYATFPSCAFPMMPGLDFSNEANNFFSKDKRRAGPHANAVLASLDAHGLASFMGALRSCACDGIEGELGAIHTMTRRAIDQGKVSSAMHLARDVPRLIRKLAHDKYIEAFRRWIDVYRNISDETKDIRLGKALTEIEALRESRSLAKR